MTSSTVGLIFLILYFLYLDGSNWKNLIKLGLISTLEFQTDVSAATFGPWLLTSIAKQRSHSGLCRPSIIYQSKKIYPHPGLILYLYVEAKVSGLGGLPLFHIYKGQVKWKTNYIYL